LGGGDDKYRNYLIDLCNTLELDTHVHFIGNKINPYPYYKFCDLFVLSSRWEGLPNVILELIHFNKPIVSTDCVPVIKRIIGPNNGVLVNTDDIDSLAQGILIGLDSKTNYLYKNTKAEFIEVFNV
jgi:glycosyltransferase involved in cell wall biosynthesis